MTVSTAQIYDAVLDDDLFGAVLTTLAAALGARSFASSWQFADGRIAWACDSGAWSAEQLELYMHDYAADDVWSTALIGEWRPGRAIDVREMVSDDTFVRSRLHDGFLRPIGDDMRDCVSVGAQNASGIGAVSFHQGQCAKRFDPRRVAELDAIAPHVARMLALRSRFAALERGVRQSRALANVVDVPIVLVTRDLRLVEANAAAEALILAGVLRVARGRLRVTTRVQPALEQAVAQALDPHQPVAGAIGLPDGGGEVWPFSVVAAPAAEGGGARQAMLVGAVRRRDPDADDARRLRLVYGLSPAEAALALALAAGATLAGIAEQRGVALATVRFQVKSIARKLDCRGQSDIVRIVGQLPPLRLG